MELSHLERSTSSESVCRAEIETQMQRTNVWTPRGERGGGLGGGGVMNWAIGIDMYTLMCIKLMPNKNLQYKKTNKTTNTKLSLGYLYGNMLI